MAGDVVDFDFEGSLQLARRLWTMAEEIQAEDIDRNADFTTAKARFEGPHAESFVARREEERTSRTTVIESLREDARQWASAWADAMHQQNKNNRAAKVEQIRADRHWGERFIDSFVGDDSEEQVPVPERPQNPWPPEFGPTASLIDY